jgi:hypothetical protein
MLIIQIAEISDNLEKSKEIQKIVQKKRDNGDYKPFLEILQEEIDKYKKATKNPDQSVPSSITKNSSKL